MNRHDLTNWIIHFVHKRNWRNDPLEFSYDWNTMNYIDFPDSFTMEGKPIFKTYKDQEDEYGLEEDAPAISVLKKILYDGYIRTGWSFRGDNPTIYGPKSAVCLTEMPLYALIEYSKNRNDDNYIQPYGVAILKNEFFQVGGRPVIYGLSTKHQEASKNDPNFGIGLRTLSSECGIGLREMYRYVYTNLSNSKVSDWTHEREWRWADLDENFYFPGLPLFASHDGNGFSKVIIIVKTNEELEDIQEYILHLYHSNGNNYGLEYNLSVIENTYILSIENLASLTADPSTIKIDDLPLFKIPQLRRITVSQEIKEKVKNAIIKASEIANIESKRKFKEIGDRGGAGFAYVITFTSNSEITQALIELGLARSYGEGYYDIKLKTEYIAQSLFIGLAGAEVAAEYLSKELGQSFYTRTRWD